jgi:hypothetical protein
MPRPAWTAEQCVEMGKKGQAASRVTRRAQMWARYQERAQHLSRFEAFQMGWKAHREWSARRRSQKKTIAERHQ